MISWELFWGVFLILLFLLFLLTIIRVLYENLLEYIIIRKCKKKQVNSFSPINSSKSNVKYWYNKSFSNDFQYIYYLSPFKHKLWIASIINWKSFNRYLSIDQFNVIVILASFHLVTINKKITTTDLNYIDNFFSQFLPKDKKSDLIWLLGMYKKNNINLSYELKDNLVLKSLIKGANIYFTTQHKYTLIYYLFELAGSEREIGNQELDFIYRLAKSIGLSKQELNSITSLYFSTYIPYPEAGFTKSTKSKHQSKEKKSYTKNKYQSHTRLENSLSIFNLQKDATNQEIKSAYRQAVKKYHPDRVAHLGEEHVLKATTFFKRITVAYNYLHDSKGIK
jgi:DnaJ like chaperone protein